MNFFKLNLKKMSLRSRNRKRARGNRVLFWSSERSSLVPKRWTGHIKVLFATHATLGFGHQTNPSIAPGKSPKHAFPSTEKRFRCLCVIPEIVEGLGGIYGNRGGTEGALIVFVVGMYLRDCFFLFVLLFVLLTPRYLKHKLSQ